MAETTRAKSRASSFRIAGFLFWASLALGCSQVTQAAPTYRQTVTTRFEVNTNVPTSVWINDRLAGTTPVNFLFNYDGVLDRSGAIGERYRRADWTHAESSEC